MEGLGKMAADAVLTVIVCFIMLMCVTYQMVGYSTKWVEDGIEQSSPSYQPYDQTEMRDDWTDELEKAYTELYTTWEGTGYSPLIIHDYFITGTNARGEALTVPFMCPNTLKRRRYTEKVKETLTYGGIVVSLGYGDPPCLGWKTFDTELELVRYLAR